MIYPTPAADLVTEQLTAWLYCLRTPTVAVCAIRQSTGFILVDSGVVGYEHAYMHALAEIAGGAPRDVALTEILLTHCDNDHIGSAAALTAMTGARVRGPAIDAEVIEGRAIRPHPRLRDWEVALFEQVGHLVPTAPRVALDKLLNDGDILGWERPAQIIAAPGHTAGSVAVYFPDDRTLIAGDAVATISGEPTTGVFNVDPDQADESFRRLAMLDVSVLCVGHGPPITTDAHARLIRAVHSRGPLDDKSGAPRA